MPFSSTNSTTRVFPTGITGFVSGAILEALHKAHPDIHITALVRKESDAKALQEARSNFTPIIGTLSQHLLASSAAAADFIILAGGDDIPAVCAMIDGIASSRTPEPTVAQLIV